MSAPSSAISANADLDLRCHVCEIEHPNSHFQKHDDGISPKEERNKAMRMNVTKLTSTNAE